MLPRICRVKMDDCTLCCDSNTTTQSSSCSSHVMSWESVGTKENQSRQLAFCLETNTSTVCLLKRRLNMTGCSLPLFNSGFNLMSSTWNFLSLVFKTPSITGCGSFQGRAEHTSNCLFVLVFRLEQTQKPWFKLCTVSVARHLSMSTHSVDGWCRQSMSFPSTERRGWMEWTTLYLDYHEYHGTVQLKKST